MRRFAQIIVGTAFLGLCAFPSAAIARTRATISPRPNQNAASSYRSFTSAYTLVRSSTRQRLWVQVVASGDSSSGFSLMMNFKSGKHPLAPPFEFHQWSFELTGESLTYSSKDGSGALNAGSQIRPYGKVNLRLNRVSTVATPCARGNGNRKTDRVTVAGTMAFDTRTKAWGTIGQPRGTFSFASGSSILYQNCSGCTAPPAPQCLSGYCGGAHGTPSMRIRRWWAARTFWAEPSTLALPWDILGK